MADFTATMDLDARSFLTDLQNLEARFTSFASKASAASAPVDQFSQSITRSGEASERLLASSHRVAGQMGHFARDMASGASGAQLFESALIGLEKSLHLPLGALAGLAAFGYMVAEAEKTEEAIKKLKEEIGKLQVQAARPVEVQTFSEMHKTAEELEKKLGEVSKGGVGTAFQRVLADMFSFHPTGKSVSENLEEQQKLFSDTSKAGAAAKEKLAEKLEQEVGIKRTGFDIGPEAAKLAEIEEKRKEAIGGSLSGAETAAINEKFDLEKAGEERKIAAKEREFELEKQIADIKAAGIEVEERTAKAKLEAAEKELAAPHAREETPKLEAKAAEAKAAVAEARTKAEDQQRAIDLEKKLVDIRGAGGKDRETDLEIAKAKLEAAQAEAAAHPEDKKKELDVQKSRLDVVTADEALKDDKDKQAKDEQRDKEKAERDRASETKANLADELYRRKEALNPAGLSLKEIAGAGIIGSTATAQARQAIREEEMAKQRQLAGDLRGAQEHQNRAEQIKKALGLDNKIDKDALKDLQKESRDLLKDIKKNTEGVGVNK